MTLTKRQRGFFLLYGAVLLGGILLNPVPQLIGFGGTEQSKASSPARPTTEPRFVLQPGGTPRDGCLPASLARGAQVIAVGAYEGGAHTDLAFEGVGDRVGRISLTTNEDGPPLLLVLNGHDPIIWDLRAFPRERLRAVLVYGYDPQGLAGLPPGTAHRFIVGPQTSACGEAETAHEEGPELAGLQGIVRQALGVGFDRFVGGYDPRALHLEGGSLASMQPGPPAAATILASSPIQQAGLLAGKRGLDQLVAAGALRGASPADLGRFRVANDRSRPSYVVLRETEIPGDMHGANSATFLVPDGVPMPRDRGSHNTYITEDGSCLGVCSGR